MVAVVASAGAGVAGWALALGTIVAACSIAVYFTFVATKYVYDRVRRRTPDWAAGLFAAVAAFGVFGGGWIIIAVWWTAARGTRLAHRLVS
ncbi:MAG TPA: hypothetical protein VFV91_04465 [Gaiellaceae bacterium]|nr:hypothetical protein [Gaiellaceae bacterium]